MTITSGGVPRWYLRHVPGGAGASAAGPRPLVIDLHGYAEGAELHTAISDLATLGDREGFITATPQGTGNPVHWDTRLGSPDLAFIGDVLDDTSRSLCVDLRRVYVTGFSNGAFLTSAVACQFADRVAAVAPVAGMRDVPGCHPARPVPAIGFHATADRFVQYEGGMGPGAATLPAPDGSGRTLAQAPDANEAIVPGSMDQTIPGVLAAWAARNGCEPTPTETAASSDTTRIAYSCPAGAELVLYRTEGAGHEWPGSQGSAAIGAVTGTTTFTISASELMWSFFAAHHL